MSANITFHKGLQFWEEAKKKKKLRDCAHLTIALNMLIFSPLQVICFQKKLFFVLLAAVFFCFSARSNLRMRIVHTEIKERKELKTYQFHKGLFILFA